MNEHYAGKARLIEDMTSIEQYRTILEKDNFKQNEPHWRRIGKNTISLFQVLIDQDLSDLVNVLERYPRYTEWVCEHFRYAYSYSENEANIDAASRLLFLGEPHFSGQFVRNVVRKLPKTEEMNLEELSAFASRLDTCHGNWHPIVTNHYCDALAQRIERLQLHPLQRIALMKPIAAIERRDTFEYDAKDRDAVLDIPYMT